MYILDMQLKMVGCLPLKSASTAMRVWWFRTKHPDQPFTGKLRLKLFIIKATKYKLFFFADFFNDINWANPLRRHLHTANNGKMISYLFNNPTVSRFITGLLLLIVYIKT